MHELSIAEALLGQIAGYVPAGSTLRRGHVRAGPLRAVDPDALALAWQATTRDTPYAGSTLTVELLPWRLACRACGRTWTSPDPGMLCTCGEPAALDGADDQLVLLSIDVDEPVAGGVVE